MIQREFGIELEIEGKDLHTIHSGGNPASSQNASGDNIV
jgi:hypothetical protein